MPSSPPAYRAVLVHGDLSDADRKAAPGRLSRPARAQVIVNVAVLTEGYDYTPTCCVVLLRPSSYKSTLIQMVGRGLRTVDPEEYPGRGQDRLRRARLRHRQPDAWLLEQEVNLDGHDGDGEAPTKDCPDCAAERAAGAAWSARCAATSASARSRDRRCRSPIS